MQGAGSGLQSALWVNFENAWIAMMWAPRATPSKPGPPVKFLPAAIPATCVPCSQPEMPQFTPEPAPVCAGLPFEVDCPFGQTETECAVESVVEKQASASILPARNGWIVW